MSSPTPEPVDWDELARRLGDGEVIKPADEFGRLLEGCPHDLMRWPITEFYIRYTCGRCLGNVTSSIVGDEVAGLSIRGIDRVVESQVRGVVTHEVVTGGTLKKLDRQEPRIADYVIGGLPKHTELHHRIVAALNDHRGEAKRHRWLADLCCAEVVLAVIAAWTTECVMAASQAGELNEIKPVADDPGPVH